MTATITALTDDAAPETEVGASTSRPDASRPDASCPDASCPDACRPGASCPEGPAGKACRLFGLRQESPDVHGLMVRRIYVVADSYAVYAAEDLSGKTPIMSLTFALSDDDETARTLRRAIAPLANDLARIGDAILAVKPRRADCPRFALHRHRAYAMMARAMALAFDGAAEEAKRVLDFTRRSAEAMRDSANRMRYVASITCAFLLIGAVGLALRAIGWPPFADLGSAFGARMVDVMLLGAVGAWFSVALDVRKVRMRHAITDAEMIYAGLVRVPVGVVAAAVVVLMAQGGWLPMAQAADLSAPTVHLLGFLAGFSEMLVPNALKEKAAPAAPAPAA